MSDDERWAWEGFHEHKNNKQGARAKGKVGRIARGKERNSGFTRQCRC